MGKKYTDEFWRDPVSTATTSSLIRPQVLSNLDVGLSTLNNLIKSSSMMNWELTKKHADVEKESTRWLGLLLANSMALIFC